MQIKVYRKSEAAEELFRGTKHKKSAQRADDKTSKSESTGNVATDSTKQLKYDYKNHPR